MLRVLKTQNTDNWMPTLKMSIAKVQELVKEKTDNSNWSTRPN